MAAGPMLPVLGCDGSYPGPGGAASGYLVRHVGTTLWLDAGPVARRRSTPRRACAGGRISPRTRCSTGARSSRGSIFRVGEIECRFVATDHGPPTLALRMDTAGPERRSLAYSGDTGPEWSVEELGEGIDTFLCEATFTCHDEGSARHLSGRQAGSMAAAGGVGRLVVTHRWPTVSAVALADECAEAFGRHLSLRRGSAGCCTGELAGHGGRERGGRWRCQERKERL